LEEVYNSLKVKLWAQNIEEYVLAIALVEFSHNV
jgi:hypothetical protein